MLEVHELLREILRAFGLEGYFEPLVEREGVGQLADLLLKAALLRGLDLAGLAGLLVDFSDERLAAR